ncbi:glycosyltransferase family 21 protein [Collybia nuda]|uniref:Ceramide glucosyltransferase n=1 Tax=Collybia nuda TaxID=64659 RepID=A0A9P6CDS1_9AGAR|nr:glycosyltransferase family 21 protein [Collybia nuda]
MTAVNESQAILFSLALIGLTWYVALWAIGILGCCSARKRYRLRPRSPLATSISAPGVSVLRPLKGLDTNLYENLESTFIQEYPDFEIIFSVADNDDQALPIVRDLIRKYPNVKTRVIIGETVVGVNPKVNNLIRSYQEASNDILWILDSNVMVDSGTLGRSVDALSGLGVSHLQKPQKQVALVHHVPFAFGNGGRLGSRVEEAFLNTNHAKMYIAINTIAIESCVVGKSNLYRRSDLERVNGSLKPLTNEMNIVGGERGLKAFGRYLAEDNMIASSLWHELDQRHDLSCDVARNVVGNMTMSDYIWRRVRWIRVRKHMVLAATILEPFTESIVLSVIACTSLNNLCGIPRWIVLVMHFTVWLLIDLDVYASLAGHPMPPSRRWQFIVAWTIREILALPIFLLAIVGDEVIWRGNRYQVLRNGEVKQAAHSRFRSWFQKIIHFKQIKHYEQIIDQSDDD